MIEQIHFGDCRDSLRAMTAAGVKAQTCVTSPPYFGLRDYGHSGQRGLEATPGEFIAALVEDFRCVRDVLADDGTLWVNMGDSYGAAKQLLMIPARLALALQADGWTLRQDIVWHKPNPMPESVTDRCTKAHEYIFLLTKGPRYFYDSNAMKEPSAHPHLAGKRQRVNYADSSKLGRAVVDPHVVVRSALRNRRSVWTVTTRTYKGAHFATFPPDLIRPCVLAGSRPGDIVLDPFMGSGTTAAVAIEHGRQFIGCELNTDYKPLQDARIADAHKKVDEAAAEAELAARQTQLFEDAA